ncbi:hypothetical protein KIPE111705_36945 [Kibdelosporangium persicum]|uniref:DUF222 domain-containing protein n=2 Tax=Kibdelosporangium persicum TaxID=2698649 RepID=A0ABX2F3I3_9PSEU|nr:hypothetical protein [Kibdelosporangium persicum]
MDAVKKAHVCDNGEQTKDVTPQSQSPLDIVPVAERAEVAERFWDGSMTSVKADLTREVNQRFADKGLKGLQNRLRYLKGKKNLSSREMAELHLLAQGIAKAKEHNKQATRPAPPIAAQDAVDITRDVTPVTTSDKPSGMPEAPEVNVPDQIRDAARRLASRPGRWASSGWVSLTALRDQLPHVDRAEFDKAITELSLHDPDASLIPEENQKTLTDRDRDAAVKLGGEAKHLISFLSHRQDDPDALQRVRAQGVAASSDDDLVAAMHTQGVGDELYREIRREERRRSQQAPVTRADTATAATADQTLSRTPADNRQFDKPRTITSKGDVTPAAAKTPPRRRTTRDATSTADTNTPSTPTQKRGQTKPISDPFNGGRTPADNREEHIQGQIVQAYRDLLTVRPGRDWVGLDELRARLNRDLSKEEVDQALKCLSRTKTANIVPESNRKALTDDDHAAAVRIGGEDNHLIAIAPETLAQLDNRVDAADRPVNRTKKGRDTPDLNRGRQRPGSNPGSARPSTPQSLAVNHDENEKPKRPVTLNVKGVTGQGERVVQAYLTATCPVCAGSVYLSGQGRQGDTTRLTGTCSGGHLLHFDHTIR